MYTICRIRENKNIRKMYQKYLNVTTSYNRIRSKKTQEIFAKKFSQFKIKTDSIFDLTLKTEKKYCSTQIYETNK